MLSRRVVANGLCAVALLALIAFCGCRAFEPETVIVNRAPETYITGAPQDGQGGQFHFHVFWAGSDQDGTVERFVWALTDGTIQDPSTDEDEEDARFDPADFRETLEIGHWTTRTDSIFDFQIQQGSITTADKTFHIVAVDDRGDFDRTPARLYFRSNALGTPSIEFFSSIVHSDETRFADMDTIGYGQPFLLIWEGRSPNTASFSETMLADTDTVGVIDGLFGFKYRMPLDVECNEVAQDCWNPSRLDPLTSQLVSYYEDVDLLEFACDNSGSDVFRRRMSPEVHSLLVNTIDVAGVEIPVIEQPLNFVVNFDPQTRILKNEIDPFYDDDDIYDPGNGRVYPYYVVHKPCGEIETQVFQDEDRLPQRSIAVFKAIGWDDHRDIRKADLPDEETPDFGVMFQGKFEAKGFYRGGINTVFRFSTQYTEAVPSVWDDFTNPAIGSSDTVGFIVGPFDYTVRMRSVDEHERRDGTPDSLTFTANHPPVVNCVEVVTDEAASGYHTEPCTTEIDTFYCLLGGGDIPEHPEWTSLRQVNYLPIQIYYNPYTDGIWHERPPSITELDSVEGYFYEYDLLLYADDHEEERLFQPRTTPLESTCGDPADRAFSWRYEIVSDRDSTSNLMREGGGWDDLNEISYTFNEGDYPANYDDNGVWRLRVEVFVPAFVLQFGPQVYWDYLGTLHPEWDEFTHQDAFDLTTIQLGSSRATIINRDATDGLYRPDRCAYVYYDLVRPPLEHGESCDDYYEGASGRPELDDYCAQSEPFEKRYVILAVSIAGSVFPELE